MTVRALAEGRIFVELLGTGPVEAVLCHGWGRDRSDLMELAREVGRQGSVAVVDLPGFGPSPPPSTPQGAREYADLLAEGIAELATPESPLTKPVLFGHSFGGRVALCCAARHPGRVRGLVLAGVPLLRSRARTKAPLQYRAARWLWGRGLLNDGRMEALRRGHGSADYRAATGVMRDTLVRVVGEDYGDELRAVRCPTAFCWGAQDSAAPLDQARRASELVPNFVGLHEFEGVGHDVHHQRCSAVATVITDMLRTTNNE